MLISPAINIGIGSYGANCVKQLAENFILREPFYLNYLSFHQLLLADETIVSKNNREGEFIALDANENLSIDNDWVVGNFLSSAYNDLINLGQQLNLNINFGAIHVNLFFAAYETEHLELLNQTILIIDKLKDEGTFGEVQVKCYAVLSDGRALATKEQERSITETFARLVAIRQRYNVLSHTFIFDDKNTRAVALGIHQNSLPFAMMEIVTAFLENEYRLTGALHSENRVFAIGFGMVYFDDIFFKSYMKNKILETKIDLEKISEGEKKISTQEYRDIVANYFKPYIDGEIKLKDVLSYIDTEAAPENFAHTIRCYEFLLYNLLGQHDQAILKEPIDKEDLYSIRDIIYHKIYKNVLIGSEEENKNLLELREYKKMASEYDALLEENNPAAEEIGEKLGAHEISVNELIRYYSSPKRRQGILLKSDRKSIEAAKNELEKNLQKLNEVYEKKNFILKWFGKKKYKNGREEIQNKIKLHISQLEEEETSLSLRTETVKKELGELYALQEKLQKFLNRLLQGNEDIFGLKRDYQDRIDTLPFLDYEFLHNIISTERLEKYEYTHRHELQTNIKEVLKVLFLESVQGKIPFKVLLNEKIDKQVVDIIDFKMTEYLLQEYDKFDLFDCFDFSNDLRRLKQRAYPFFNAVPTYKENPHSLKYFNDEDIERSEAFRSLLKQEYTNNIPSFIRAQSHKKFALMTIEMVEDLNDMVKHNNHMQRVSSL